MGFIGSLFGGDSGNSGGAGMNYQATGPSQAQVNDSWANSQAALQQQQQFLHALAAQGGIQNQSNVFNQQQALANQLGVMAQGGGPNPAQSQFQENANQIAAQTAGLMGSQKGISPALQARLIAQQGAEAGQSAAGRAATLQAQQQLAATQALQQQQAMMGNMAGQQVAQQQGAISGYTQGALGQQGNVLGLAGSANAANSGVAGNVASQQGKMFGGMLGGIGSVLGLSQGGEVPCYADGGTVGPQSAVGKFFKNFAGALMASPNGMATGGRVIEGEKQGQHPVPGKPKVAGDSPKNDTVPARLSPGEIIIPRSIAQHPDAPDLAARFVAAVKAKSGRGMK